MKKTITALLLTIPLTVFAQDSITLTKDNMLSMNDVFTPESVANLTKEVKELDSRTTSSDPIYLVINSPGGSIDAGLELIENLSNLRRPVHTLNLFSASMGFQTAQGLGERLITANGTLMSHKARGAFSGEFPGQLDARYGYYLKRITRLDQQAADRSKGKHTLESYRALIENEYWCDGQDCVTQGFADRVVKPSCDKSLDGTRRVVVDRFMFMGLAIQIEAIFDNCPLNTNALKYDVVVNGELLFKERSEEKQNENWSIWASKEDKPKVSAEVLFEITQKVSGVITRKKNKEVIRGY